MPEEQSNKKQVIKYLVFTFVVAYAIQIGATFIYRSGHNLVGQYTIAAMMFVPMLGVLFSGAGLKGLGWKPQIRKNIKSILIAWFSPIVMTAIGAGLYFLVFPSHFDLSGQYVVDAAGQEALKAMQDQGISYPLSVLISTIACITYAPLINAIPALGEEVGWRGFLYPQLRARFGQKKAWVIGGIIWGAWHWPLIWLIGYEYGVDYFGFPIVGMLLFCVITVALGILHDWLYERSGCIWLPAIFHGAFNAAATIPITICITNSGSLRLLGPAPNGLLAGLPLLILAAMVYLRSKD